MRPGAPSPWRLIGVIGLTALLLGLSAALTAGLPHAAQSPTHYGSIGKGAEPKAAPSPADASAPRSPPPRLPLAGPRYSGPPRLSASDQRSEAVRPSDWATALVGSEPFSATVDPLNGIVYVTDFNSSSVTLLNGTVPITSVTVGSDPYFATFDSGNGYMYVPNFNSSNVSVIQNESVVATISVGSGPYDATYDPGNGCVYVTNSNSSSVTVINGTSVVGTIRVGNQPFFGTYDPANGEVYVTNFASNNVSVILGTRLVATVNVGVAPALATYDSGNGFVYVPNEGSGNSNSTVSILNGTRVVASVNVGVLPTFGTYDSGNGYVYIPNAYSDNVSVISGMAVVASVDVGYVPYFATYDPGNGSVYVPNYFSGNVSVIHGVRVVATWWVGVGPYVATPDAADGYVYVPNFFSDNVSIFFTGYSATFTETGLPPGTGWSILTSNGLARASSTPSLSLSMGNGTYRYSALSQDPSYRCPPGSFSVDGGGVAVSLTFSAVGYPVNFTESGLPGGVSWGVTLSGVEINSTQSTISFTKSNGTYGFTLRDVPGWTTSSFTGSIAVNGQAISTSVAWVRETYPVAISETGLPAGVTWWVNFTGGPSRSSNSGTITLTDPNGSFPYAASTSDKGYSASGGTVTVAGAAVSMDLVFSRVTFTVAFLEEGLPAGTVWWVNVSGGSSAKGGSASISFQEGNGSYRYSLASSDRTYSAPEGSFSVEGAGPQVMANFSRVTYSMTFTEIGLPSGRSWSVTVGGVNTEGVGTLTLSAVTNGSYTFTVNPVTGFTAVPSSGTVSIHGMAEVRSISFTASGSGPGVGGGGASFLGLPGWEGYVLLAGVVAAFLLGAGVAIYRRGRSSPPEASEPPGPA